MPHADLFLASGGSVFEHVATNGMLFSRADRTSSRDSGQLLKAGRIGSLRTHSDVRVRSNTLSWPARCQERNQRSRVPVRSRIPINTTPRKPYPWICFVCCLRASGAGGIVRERGRFDQTRSRQRVPVAAYAADRGVFAPRFLLTKRVNVVTTTSLFTRGNAASRVRFDGKQGRICENTGPPRTPDTLCGFPTDDLFCA